MTRRRLARRMALLLSAFTAGLQAQDAATDQGASPVVRVVSLEGTEAWRARARTEDWIALTNGAVFLEGDRGRTGARTRLRLRLADHGVVTLPERTEFEISLPAPERPFSTLTILRGMSYFFHRGDPKSIRFKSRTATAAIRGTEFVFRVDDGGGTVVTMLDGEVELSNDRGAVALGGGEEGRAEPGREPAKTPMLDVPGIIQWCLYYPGVLDLADLSESTTSRPDLKGSIEAYRQGDLIRALERWPAGRGPDSTEERIYWAGLLLAVGQVVDAEAGLSGLDTDAGLEAKGTNRRSARLARALQQLIATVRQGSSAAAGASGPGLPDSSLPTEWLADSYARQARGDLDGALHSARRATMLSPNFGFAWVRVAELEFGFGRRAKAVAALERGQIMAPRNAQAVALRGFLDAAAARRSDAMNAFEQALALDGGLGNAWLGRGLIRIRAGEIDSGLEDLEMAAAVEPQRSFLRSYLGKAYGLAGDFEHAEAELALARKLDPNDPTSRLYLALLLQRANRIHDAVENLEASVRLNDNRQVYRSRQLLDQDRAVRGANLANVYVDAGMGEVGYREAARAVNEDYGNFSAHLFLANAYQELRDPNQVDLRFETAWLSEYLVANLLAPPGAGVLSQTVSQQDYGRLFERDRVGVVSATEYLSRGDWTQSGAVYGRAGNLAFAVDEFYQSRNGQRSNNDLEQLTLSVQVKQQLTPEDSVFLQGIYYDADGGNLARVYDPEDPLEVHPGLRVKERQEPILLAGYHRAWNPGNHTLFLASRAEDRLHVDNPQARTAMLFKDAQGRVSDGFDLTLDQRYRSDLELYSTEAQHIFERPDHALIVGVRYQFGQFDTSNQETNPQPPIVAPFLEPQGVSQHAVSDFQRWTGYGYYHWRVAEPLLLIGGASYDWLKYPVNHRYGPVSDQEDTIDRVSPKAGIVWTPAPDTTVRAGYARSLGGVSFDQSFRLEPSQVAGFNQAYRSLIPESIAGASSAAEFQTLGLDWAQRLATRTYLGLRAERLESEVHRQVGVLDLSAPPAEDSLTRERLDYRENILTASLHQLVGDCWTFGAVYRLSDASLHDRFVDVPAEVPSGFDSRKHTESILHQVRLSSLFNHPTGFFGQFDAIWSSQSNQGYEPDRPGMDFWQFNVWAGYRFAQRRAEVRLGLLNLTDRDYRINPLNLTPELPRERTFAVSVKLNL